ncbi:MAG TPA: YciI family protein [Polyangiaceae bacterium]|jgi:hypothetical protein
MIMHKMTEAMEHDDKPDHEIIAAVGQLINEGLKDGAFVSGEGLKPSSQRTRLVYRAGKRTVTDGPFSDARELAAGFALMRVKSKAEALSWCDKFAAVMGDVELFLGPVVEPWDLGMCPKPPNPPLRYLSMQQATARTESDAPPDPALFEKMGALIDEMTRAGVLQSAGGLSTTKHGARVHFKAGKHTLVDGPFTESKELIAGFALMDLPSKAAAIDWATRFGEVVKVNEVEIRQMAE